MNYKIIQLVIFLIILGSCTPGSDKQNSSDFYCPSTISPEAQIALKEYKKKNRMTFPGPDDHDAWNRLWSYNEKKWMNFNDSIAKLFQPQIIDTSYGGVHVLDIRPKNWKESDKLLIYTHGGGYTLFSAKTMLMGSVPVADRTGLRVISIDYTNPPGAKHPEILKQVITVVRSLLNDGYKLSQIGMYGDSAGGAIIAGAILKMRDDGIGMPAAVVLISPWSDITESGDSYYTLKDADPILNFPKALGPSSLACADPKEFKHPYVSPVYADYTKGFPPTLIQGGTKEIFLSNFVRQYQAMDQAGIEVKLDLYEGMWHVFQEINFDLPESVVAHNKMSKFFKQHLDKEQMI